MNEEEFKDFKNYIIKYRNLTSDLANKCITPYMLEQFRGYNDRFDYEPDLFSKYDVPNRIDELQQRYKQLQNNWNELKKFVEDEIIECKAIINTILPEFEKIMPRSSGKTVLTNEYNQTQTIIKCFEVMLNKMQEMESGNNGRKR